MWSSAPIALHLFHQVAPKNAARAAVKNDE